MNAVIALCHFCEVHGPSVLFCTQTFHSVDTDIASKEKDYTTVRKSWYGPLSLIRKPTKFSPTISFSGNTSKITDPCDGCTSLSGQQRGFISNDHEACVSYISTQYPLHSEVFSMVRQACVRSLSCEVCPGREGPIYFGDEHQGYVLSHTFFMKDSQARGFQSWYSIVIVMMDKIFLLNSWQFLVKHFYLLIQELQGKAKKVYDGEQTEIPQRAVRINSVTRMTPDNFRRQRGNVKARSIKELCNDNNVYLYLHLWFTWILRAGARRISEKLVEGFPSEDTVVDLEKQEETEGDIKVHSKMSLDSTTMHLQKKFEEINSVKEETEESEIKSLRELQMLIGQEKFHILSYHTVIGNQIIFKGEKKLIKDIIMCLKELLPRGCFHPIFYSATYEDSWKCNLLGVPIDAVIPDHVLSSVLHICVTIEMKVTKQRAYDFLLETTAVLPEKMPQVLTEMERAVNLETFNLSVLHSFLFTLKEIWMNKVKVLFAFSRGGQRSSEETSHLLQVLGAQEHDKQVLKFWMTGLSTQYKTRILSSSIQQGFNKADSIL